MSEGEKLLKVIQDHMVEVIEAAMEVIGEGIVGTKGEWKFDALTVIYGRRIDDQKDGEDVDTFQQTVATDDSIAGIVGMLEISKAEFLRKIM